MKLTSNTQSGSLNKSVSVVSNWPARQTSPNGISAGLMAG